MAAAARKHRFGFRLRTLFALTTLACVFLAWVAQPISEYNRQQRTIARLEALGAKVALYGVATKEPSIRLNLVRALGYHCNRYRCFSIDLSGCPVDDEDLLLLEELPHLHRLSLNGTDVTDAGLEVVSRLSTLHELDLSHTAVTDEGVGKLASVSGLVWLDVRGADVSYAALEGLDACLPRARFAEQRAIAELDVVGAQAVAARPQYPVRSGPFRFTLPGGVELKGGQLILGMNRRLSLRREDLAHLAYLNSAEWIALQGVEVEPGGFAGLPELPLLENVEVWYANITDQDLADLTRQKQLTALTIAYCDGVTDEGVAALSELKDLRSVEVLECPGVSLAAIERLREALPEPGCEIRYPR